ncbi:large ATP-binding protein [Streptomyces clavuligerus]|uniref:Large ATP-binding protein n=4 Tax=Streptomyces clavuligerus TaxID=1901 RepID=E2PW53_STRCL|nr:large ATP-binding protein [Streptomyces clavuligerus]
MDTTVELSEWEREFERRYRAECLERYSDPQALGSFPFALRIAPRDSGEPEGTAAHGFPAARRVLLRGWDGDDMGEVLRQEAVRSAEDPEGPVPFLLPEHALADISGLSAPDSLLAACGSPLAMEEPPGWVERILLTGRALLLIDGVEGFAPPVLEEARTVLAGLLERYPAVSVTVTARLDAVPGSWLAAEGFTEYRLCPLAPDEISAFIDSWDFASGSEDTARDTLLRLLADSPLLADLATHAPVLRMFCSLPWADGRRTQPWRTLLPRLGVSLLAGLRYGGTPGALSNILAALQGLALWLQRNGLPGTTQEQAVRQIERSLPAEPEEVPGTDATAAELLSLLLDDGVLLTEPAPGRVVFTHPVHQVYAAAREAVETDALGEVVRHAHDPHWRDVALCAARHVLLDEDRASFVAALRDRADRDPVHAERLALLADEALRELPAPLPAPRRRVPERPAASAPPPLLTGSVVEVRHRPSAATGPESERPVTVTLSGEVRPAELTALAASARRAECYGLVDLTLLRLLPRLHTVVIAGHPRLTRLDDLVPLPLLRSLVLVDCPRLRDLTALTGTGVMFLELAPLPEESVIAPLAAAPRLRVLYLPTPGERSTDGLARRLRGVSLLPGLSLDA